ncbi:MAG: Gfo/Idh/MocA family oxidoreductase, partial [Bacteroidota bacterium]
MGDTIKVLVVGCGHMGSSHARAYHKIDGFEIVGLVDRGGESCRILSDALGGLPRFEEYEMALEETRPDAVAI